MDLSNPTTCPKVTETFEKIVHECFWGVSEVTTGEVESKRVEEGIMTTNGLQFIQDPDGLQVETLL